MSLNLDVLALYERDAIDNRATLERLLQADFINLRCLLHEKLIRHGRPFGNFHGLALSVADREFLGLELLALETISKATLRSS